MRRTANSPVETSAHASPTAPSAGGETAASQAEARASSRPSSVTVPGVTRRTISRRTTDLPPRFLASLGSSVCSQTATRKPDAIRRAR